MNIIIPSKPFVKPPALPIVKANTKFKVVVSLNVQEEVKKLCKEISHVEWSGILYYTINGIEIRLEAILPMDKGTAGFTEYDTDSRFITFLEEKQKELGIGDEIFATWKRGHIHSHVNMGTSFSGTDTDELNENVGKHIQYLSVIVNNRNEYNGHVAKEAIVSKVVKLKTGLNQYQETADETRNLVLYDVDFYFEREEVDLSNSFLTNLKRVLEEKKRSPVKIYGNQYSIGLTEKTASLVGNNSSFVNSLGKETTLEGFLCYHLMTNIEDEEVKSQIEPDQIFDVNVPLNYFIRNIMKEKDFVSFLHKIAKYFKEDYEWYFDLEEAKEDDLILEINVLIEIVTDARKLTYNVTKKKYFNYLINHLKFVQTRLKASKNVSISK